MSVTTDARLFMFWSGCSLACFRNVFAAILLACIPHPNADDPSKRYHIHDIIRERTQPEKVHWLKEHTDHYCTLIYGVDDLLSELCTRDSTP